MLSDGEAVHSPTVWQRRRRPTPGMGWAFGIPSDGWGSVSARMRALSVNCPSPSRAPLTSSPCLRETWGAHCECGTADRARLAAHLSACVGGAEGRPDASGEVAAEVLAGAHHGLPVGVRVALCGLQGAPPAINRRTCRGTPASATHVRAVWLRSWRRRRS